MERDGTAVPETAVAATPRLWQRVLLWAGLPLCLLGLYQYRLWEQWPVLQFRELMMMAVTSLGAAWVAHRVLGWQWASGLACFWLTALVLFAGPLPVLATGIFAVAALALGGRLLRHERPALQMICGLILAGSLLAWALPLPVHFRAVYLGGCVGLILWQRRQLLEAGRSLAREYRVAVAAAPGSAAIAAVALGLASTGCWLPTLQWDDIVYHLRLPWQLLEQHRYPMTPGLHVWSFAPWLGDVIQSVPQVMTGEEARGPVNTLWIALTAAGVWRLTVALGGPVRVAWLAIALYASVPLTASLAGSMQTETPTAALLVWLVALVADARTSERLPTGAILVGGLLGLKLAAGAFALLVLPWAIWRHRPLRRWPILIGAALAALFIGGSSYVYAGLYTGNPFLPLLNGWFHSPYFHPVNFNDLRWHTGFNAMLPWRMTFDTDRFLEAIDGGGGFLLIGLAGAWLLALLQRRTMAIALLSTVLLCAPLMSMQYLRYAFPALVVALPVLAVTAFRVEPRHGAWLLLGLGLLNFGFQANAFWMLRSGAIRQVVLHRGADAPLFSYFTPERNLAAQLHGVPHGNVLALDPANPFVAELGFRGRSLSGYDLALQSAAASAEADSSGQAWAALLHRERITDVLLRPAQLTPAQRAGLVRLQAQRQAVDGEAQWWRIPRKQP